jgi:hypothetical protein
MDDIPETFDRAEPERMLVRDRTQRGVLPRGPARELYGGNGTGATCSGCDRVIRPDQIEFEIHAGSVLIMHSHCMRIWFDEWANVG